MRRAATGAGAASPLCSFVRCVNIFYYDHSGVCGALVRTNSRLRELHITKFRPSLHFYKNHFPYILCTYDEGIKLI